MQDDTPRTLSRSRSHFDMRLSHGDLAIIELALIHRRLHLLEDPATATLPGTLPQVAHIESIITDIRRMR